MTQQEPTERLAPVTYLFGTPSTVAEGHEQSEAPAAHQPSAGVPSMSVASTEIPSMGVPSTGVPSMGVPNTGVRSTGVPNTGMPTTAAPAPAEHHAAPSPRAENVSMHALTRRGMSVAEMTTLLERRELEPDDVAAEIERLEGAGLLDDDMLAENLVRTLHERKGLGRSAIAAELRRRKVDGTAVEVALEAIDDDDELSRATEVAVKRAGQLRSLAPDVAKRRLMAFMQRRGYSGSVLSSAVSTALSGSSGADSGGPRFR